MKTKGLALALWLGLLLTACGGATEGAPQQPTSLHVLRPANQFPIYGQPGPKQQPFPRLERTINDASAAQQLYTAALALPIVNGTYPCPFDSGVVYQLDFLSGSVLLQHMDVHASGCRWLYMSSTDIRWTNDAFNLLLAKTIGIPSLLPSS